MSNLDLFSGKDKAEIAIDRLKAFCPPEGYYVAFSGGKDSVVILDLVKKSGCKFDAHYNLTTVDPPELVKFVRTFPEVEIRKPTMNMWKLIKHKGFLPTRKIRYCCDVLKEEAGADRHVVTGIRWSESHGRSKRKMVEACFKNSRKFYVRPIIDWTTEDVWEYIKTQNLKYCSLYDEGFKRVGCICCPMAGEAQMMRELKRWPTYRKAYIKACNKAIINKPPNRDGLSFTGEEMFNRWIHRKHIDDPDTDQAVMFE